MNIPARGKRVTRQTCAVRQNAPGSTGTLARSLATLGTLILLTTISPAQIDLNLQTTVQTGAVVVGSAGVLGSGDVLLAGGNVSASGLTRALFVGGNFRQTAGAELTLRLGGTASGQFDRLVVLGSANVGGRLQVEALSGFAPVGGDTFTVVTAGGGVNGQFAQVQDNLTAGTALQATLRYSSNSVVLVYVQSDFRGFVATPNQAAAAGALDVVVTERGAAELVAFLNTQQTTSLPAAFEIIAPEEIGAIFEISRSAAKMQALSVEHRLDDIRAARLPAPAPESGFSKDGKTAKEIRPIAPPENRWGFWAQGGGEFVDVGDTSNARGYDFDSGGVTFGVDYRFSDHFAAGVLLNYTRTRAELGGDGRIDANAFRGGLYAGVFGENAYLNAYVGGGYNDYDIRREGFDGMPHGSTEGGEFNGLVAAGYDAHFGDFTIGPVASYQYTYTSYDGYLEDGSLAPLRIDSQHAESSRTNVGLRMSYAGHIGSALVTPEVRATWQHEFGDVAYATDARFAFGGPQFTSHSAEVGRDSLLLRAGFSVQHTPTFSTYAYYEGELCRTNYEAHNVYIGGRLSF